MISLELLIYALCTRTLTGNSFTAMGIIVIIYRLSSPSMLSSPRPPANVTEDQQVEQVSPQGPSLAGSSFASFCLLALASWARTEECISPLPPLLCLFLIREAYQHYIHYSISSQYVFN